MADKVRITVRRRDSLKMPRVVLHINIDGVRTGKVNPDGTAFLEIEPGTHDVEVLVVKGIRSSGTFEFREGTCLNIEAKLGKIELSVSG